MLGYLHTAEAHVATFRALTGELAPGVADLHAVDEDLLAYARAHGLDETLRERVRSRLAALRAEGAEVIVCTCSTLSGLAESLSAPVGVPVVRVDRPMARAAVAAGRRIAVVAALTATLAPTTALLAECAREAGRTVELVEAPCLDAWPLFLTGDAEGYARAVARHVRRLAQEAPGTGGFDVFVLAQASMAPALAHLGDLPVPVLASPRQAVTAAAALLPAAG
ncbi:aspartate/glutamate racemase family protein [Streptomyces hoynatensis]|uniref:Arylsulfatase n=1 Tax=Streptomyces hoynatensis TaxID=1141874 RepID=A0A3A9ZCJ2_9ACTN|nr:aspartate/glutamate racemase family protein [Streptomyces hoynatensis]RKN45905.1 hypothetical protein D7294_05605 [Streptomyces hoynatensis]